MQTFLHGWRRKAGCVTLAMIVCCGIGFYAVGRHQKQIAARIRIYPQALEAIDRSQLDESVRKFIALLDTPDKVIEQPANGFSALLTLSSQKVELSTARQYEFSLPANKASLQRLARYGGEVPCWPMMTITVDAKSEKIRSVMIYDQCL